MAIPNATHQEASDAIAALGAAIGMHTAAAGTNGANEANGGGYTRQTTTWTPGTTGINTGSAVNVPCAAGTYVEGSIWNQVTVAGSTFIGSAAFTNGDVVVSGSGATVTITPTITV